MGPSLTFRVFIPLSLGYLFASVFRPILSIIAPNIVHDVGVDATNLGLLTSAFFLGALIFQLPLGILLDRYGPRLVNVALLLIVALGALIFSLGDNVILLVLGRALIGIGTSSCMATCFKAFALWYPPERLPLVNGLAVAAGGIGMMGGTLPVEWALQVSDWRGIHQLNAVVVAIVAVLVFTVVPRHETKTQKETFKNQVKGLGTVLTARQFWQIAPLVMISTGVYAGVLHLWAGPWLRDVAGFDRGQIANTLLGAAFALVVSAPLAGYVASLLRGIGMKTMTFAVSCMFVFLLVQVAIYMEMYMEMAQFAEVLWLLFGLFGPLSLMTYAALNQTFPKTLAGRVNTSMTLMWMIGAFAVQTGIGVIIDQFPTTASGGYASEGYGISFAVLITLQVAAFLWYGITGFLWRDHLVELKKPAE